MSRPLAALKPYAALVVALLALLLLAFQLRVIPFGGPVTRFTEDTEDTYLDPVKRPVLGPSRNVSPFEDIAKISKQEPPSLPSAEGDLAYLRQHALTGTQRIIPDMEGLKKWNLKRLQYSYHSYLDNSQVLCERVMKIGNDHVWGNHLCDDDNIRPRKPCIASSLAVSRADISQYVNDVKRLYGCEIQDSAILRNTTVDVLRLDQDGGEWQTLAKMAASGEISRVRQLVLSLTTLQELFANEEELRQRLQILKILDEAGFRIFHSILREDGPVVNNAYVVVRTAVYEVALLNTKLYHPATGPQPENSGLSNDEKNMQLLRNLTLKNGRLPTPERIKSLSGLEVHYHYHRYLDNPSMQCALSLKMGQLKDGGYRMCDDETVRPSKSCLVYSFGINNEFSFDDDMARLYGCDVFSFDPSMPTSHRRSQKVTFYRLGIGGTQGRTKDTEYSLPAGWRAESLTDIKYLLGHQAKPLDVLKIDVEGAEWPALVDLGKSGELSMVRQLIIEFHVSHSEKTEVVREKLTALTCLAQAGFRMFFSRINWHCGMVNNVYPVTRSRCYENTYINTRFEV